MDKTTIHMVPEPRKKELVNATYGIIGCMQQGHNQLGPGCPSTFIRKHWLWNSQLTALRRTRSCSFILLSDDNSTIVVF